MCSVESRKLNLKSCLKIQIILFEEPSLWIWLKFLCYLHKSHSFLPCWQISCVTPHRVTLSHFTVLCLICWHLKGWIACNLSLFPAHAHRGGLPRGTGPRCLPETARLRGVPNPGEGLPSRVSGQLPGGSRRTGHLLHPPPQQTQEIHLPVHWRLFFRPGSGESGQMRLYKVFLIKKREREERKKKKKETTPLGRFPPLQICFMFLPLPSRLTWSPWPFTLHSPTNPVFFVKTLKKKGKKKQTNKRNN